MEDMKNSVDAGCYCKDGECGCSADEAKNEVGSAIHAHKETQVEKVDQDTGATYMPAVDIIDNEKEALLLLDVPGVLEGDVDLTLEKSILTIKARPQEKLFEGRELLYSEYGIGDYRRSFSLTEDIDADGITASMKDGVLKVRLPKRAPVTKKISVGANA